MPTATQERAYINPRNIKPFANFDVSKYDDNFKQLAKDLNFLGIGLDSRDIQSMIATQRAYQGIAMDAIQSDVTTPSISTPVQFLQEWLPGFVNIITQARKIDDLVGISTMGSWEDEEVVQGYLELLGSSQVYGDYTNMPESSWNTNFEKRTVVRFEEGLQVGPLEEKRAARIRLDTGTEKRNSAALALEIIRNYVGFYGYNNGANLTYGFLNDPSLPAYIPVPNGAGGSPLWKNKTFLEIQKDILLMVSTLENQSGDNIDPRSMDLTLGVATNVVNYLSTTSNFGISVLNWIESNFKRMRIVSAPELNDANGGADVCYLYADRIADNSTDDGRVFQQIVPAKFQVIGISKLVKQYQEDYSNATAGTWCKRPWAVVRTTGMG